MKEQTDRTEIMDSVVSELKIFNPWWTFDFPIDLKDSYHQFLASKRSSEVLALVVLLCCVGLYPCIEHFFHCDKYHDCDICYGLLFASLVSYAVAIVSGVLLIISTERGDPASQARELFLQGAVAILFNAGNCLLFIDITIRSEVVGSELVEVLLVLAPIVAVTLLSEWRTSVLLCSWLLSVAALAVFSATKRSTCFSQLAFFIVASLAIVLETTRRQFALFQATKQLLLAAQEIRQFADEERANELRHMIANVAHDLKTPLSSFMVGVELLQHLVQESAVHVQQEARTLSLPDLQTLLGSVTSGLQDISSTNSFMVMMINRCIDYTKASKGIALKPKNETISLTEAVMLPLKCMRNVQQKVSIELQPWSTEICECIMTDKQWLQENILCLLSNASKYSDGGTVTISLSLRELDRSVDGDAQRSSFSTTSEDTEVTRAARHHNRSSVSMMLLVEVQDEGIGVPKEMAASLFSPFRQTQKLAGGTGLGLFSLAKRVEALGGRYGVRARSPKSVAEEAGGSCFWFTIPYRPDPVSAAEHAAELQTLGLSGGLGPSSWGVTAMHAAQGGASSFSSFTTSYASSSTAFELPQSPRGQGDLDTLRPHSFLVPPSPLCHTVRSYTSTCLTARVSDSSHTSPRHAHTHAHEQTHALALRDSSMHATVPLSSPSPSQTVLPPRVPLLALPRGTSAPAAQPPATQPAAHLGPRVIGSLRILLAEDSPTISKVEMAMLQRQGHRVVLAENGAIALKCFAASIGASGSGSGALGGERFDVVLMDLQMPVMDGLEATRRIRQLEQQHQSLGGSGSGSGSGVRQLILGVSANSDDDTIQEAHAVGIDAFLAKPFTVAAFTDMFQQQLLNTQKL